MARDLAALLIDHRAMRPVIESALEKRLGGIVTNDAKRGLIFFWGLPAVFYRV